MVGCSNSCSTNSSGERAHGKEPPAGAGAGKQRATLLGRQRRRARFRRKHLRDDRHELVVPAAQRRGVARAERGERVDGLADVGPPLERAAVAGDERDVELGLDQLRAVPLERKIRVPRHGGDGAQEERMGVVEESAMARIFDRAQSAAGHRAALDGERLHPGLAEIGLQDEPVVPGAENNRVVGAGHATPSKLTRAANSVCSLPRLRGRGGEGVSAHD